MESRPVRIRFLGLRDYSEYWQKMKTFTDSRSRETCDEIWLLEHPPVYTQGLNGKPEHILDPGAIPVIRSDRGGQATYHGPGQLVMYTLLSIRHRKIGIRQLVSMLEQSAIDTLKQYGIDARSRADAPGVYVDGSKIASIGLRVRRGCSYHGMSLNVAGDLSPFSRINVCGFPSLSVTSLYDLRGPELCHEVAIPLVYHFLDCLGESTESNNVSIDPLPTSFANLDS
ncbi:MAG: lipoyl(octanoyl) transferase LipB [Pseudomonadota bacterium]|nr:lipoyl(octanoyl) transferase LipB [Pseudomonadota bacterium]